MVPRVAKAIEELKTGLEDTYDTVCVRHRLTPSPMMRFAYYKAVHQIAIAEPVENAQAQAAIMAHIEQRIKECAVLLEDWLETTDPDEILDFVNDFGKLILEPTNFGRQEARPTRRRVTRRGNY